MKRAIVALSLAGCWTSSTPTPSTPSETPSQPHAKAPVPVDKTPIEMTVTEGTPSTLPDGVTIDVRGVMYAHLANSKNLSRAQLTVGRGVERVEVPLQHTGDEAEEERWSPALGWEFRLEYADPYQSPSTVSITVRRQ